MIPVEPERDPPVIVTEIVELKEQEGERQQREQADRGGETTMLIGVRRAVAI